MKNIKDKLENMKPEKLTEGEKNILWSKIDGGIRARRTYNKKQPTFLGMSTRFAAAALVAVLVLTSGSFMTVSAANAAAPGDALFPIDEALERIELFFTRQEERAERRLAFAQERLEEAQEVLGETDVEDEDEDTPEGDEEDTTRRFNRVVRAERVLEIALERLEALREELLAEGDDDAVAEIDETIAALMALAEDHIAFLQGVHDEIKETREEIKDLRGEIRVSKDEIKFRFDHRIEDEDDDDEEEDENSKRRGNGLFDGDKHDWKLVLCHIPPGEPENAHTIAVGSPAAARAHLAHGDTEGRCDVDHDDGDEEDNDPDITDVDAKNIEVDSATLVCEIESDGLDTDVWFEWGTDENNLTEETAKTEVEGNDDRDTVEVDLDGLEENTEYFFRCIAENDEGRNESSARDFTTGEIDEDTTLTVIKVVVNDDGATSTVEDFTLYIDDDEVDSGEANELEPGDYVVSEDEVENYEATFSGHCDEEGNVTLEEGDELTCTITNDDVEPEPEE